MIAAWHSSSVVAILSIRQLLFPPPLPVPLCNIQPTTPLPRLLYNLGLVMIAAVVLTFTLGAVQAELETRLQLGETAEQRRLRERNRVEEADNDLTEDLFGGGSAAGRGGGGGLSGLALKNMQVCVVCFVCSDVVCCLGVQSGRVKRFSSHIFKYAHLFVVFCCCVCKQLACGRGSGGKRGETLLLNDV